MNKLFSVLIVLCLSACGAGSGENLDENGLPISGGNGPGASPSPTPSASPIPDSASLAEIQNEIFSPICSGCHAGANAPRGLRLDSVENSFEFLVGVSADQIPSLLRVNPGDPDTSYLVHKIEGADTIVANRMPLNGTPLTETQIQLIKDWISAGAPADSSNESSLQKTSAQIITVQKQQNDLTFQFLFNHPIDSSSATQSNIFVYKEINNQRYLLDNQSYSVSTDRSSLTITISQYEKSQTTYVVKLITPGVDGIRDGANELADLSNVTDSNGEFYYVSK